MTSFKRAAAVAGAVWAAAALSAGCGSQTSAGGAPDGSADRASSPIDDATAAGDTGAGANAGADAGAGARVDAGAGVDGGGGADGSCAPVASCPPGVTCGRYTDPCGGRVFACGGACPSGQACVAAPGDPTSQSCAWKSGVAGLCASKCGEIGFDACGVAIDCGACSGGTACVGNRCVAPTAGDSGAPAASDACAPITCSPDGQTQLCGTVDDGCGHTLHCSCSAGVCLGGVCAAEPPECFDGDGGAKCGSVENACGSATITCPGACTGDTKCVSGACVSCTPVSCGSAVCGTVASNGCGPAAQCGTCEADAGEVCASGECCTPETCDAVLDGGADAAVGCAPVDLGCGIERSCAPCPSGQACVSDTCVACVPKTCGDFSGGCGHSDGCGYALDCCAAGTTCQGTICCGPGMVDYDGACCTPQCDPDQPAGPQVSCGQILYCSGSR